jgi:hypothetical protein
LTSADDASPGIFTSASWEPKPAKVVFRLTVSPGRAADRYVIRHVRLSCSAIAPYASATAELELAGK